MKRRTGDVLCRLSARLLFFCSLIVLLAPMVIMFIRSLERNGLDNYRVVLERISIGRSLLNSVYVVGATLIITVLVCSLAAFAFSKMHFWGKQLLFIVLLMGMIVPAAASLFPVFRITRSIGLLNKLTALVGPYVSGSAIFGLLMLKIYYDDLPNELMDAARIDGASFLQIFARIYFPMSGPGLSVLLINTFCSSWNELMTSLTLIDDEKKYTMALLPYRYQLELLAQYHNPDNWAQIFSCLILCMIPVIIFYALAQHLIFENASGGAVKG